MYNAAQRDDDDDGCAIFFFPHESKHANREEKRTTNRTTKQLFSLFFAHMRKKYICERSKMTDDWAEFFTNPIDREQTTNFRRL